uniref:Uncharacterized protein n=1 Tax=Candidatus Kentrum sp. DK TaxID=2126562 RepID=A0A450T3H9_9GAMM|nr:MAG: hypothetical protein BECKDK2373B_GA0170837_10962 [Candidatus Kentron sp. DK]
MLTLSAVRCVLDGDYGAMERCFSRVIQRTLRYSGAPA